MVQKTLLTDSPKNLVRRYALALKQEGIPVEKFILFGSYAKKHSRPDSDLDICVVSKSFGKHPLQESMNLAAVAVKIDSMIEPHPYHPDDLRNKYDPLVKEILTHGISLDSNLLHAEQEDLKNIGVVQNAVAKIRRRSSLN